MARQSSDTRPFAPFEWMLALRYLRAKRAESFISVISAISLVGIALGVATLIIVMAVMNGFRHELLSRVLGLQGHVVVQGIDGNLPNFDSVADHVRKVAGVTLVAPIVDGQAVASSDSINTPVYVRGMRLRDLKAFTIVSKTLSPGALAHYSDGDSVIIGARVAQKLRVVPGMSVTLLAPHGNITPFGITPRVKTYTVAGTFDVGMSEYDQTFVFMPLSEAQLYFNMANTVTGLEVMVRDPDQVDGMVAPIGRAAGPYARIVTWKDINSTFFGAIETERNVMFLILTLIIL
ncbi:MAG: ABC transporter permease, partial [Alphaproteobacteria bacterium]|nr:ABC transporter permease [Alphaproteobacteria bacterium]